LFCVNEHVLFQVDVKGFYVKIICNKEERLASSLYKP